jgi:hypothetical protein
VPYFWSRLNQCQTVAVRDSFQRNGDHIRRERYPGCAQQAEVVVMSVVGNSHQWHASATDEFWAFFRRFRRLPGGTVLATAPASPPPPTALHVFPNPGQGSDCTLALTLPTAQVLTVALHDGQGRVVRSLSAQRLRAGAQALSLPTAGLPAGLYLVRVRTATGTQRVRFSLSR